MSEKAACQQFNGPILTPQNTDFYFRVFDANGNEHEGVTEVNIETGEIEQFKRDDCGMLIVECGDIARIRTTIPTPVRLEKLEPRYKPENA